MGYGGARTVFKFHISVWSINLSFKAEFPEVFETHGSSRVVNGFDTKDPLPFQLQLVIQGPSFQGNNGWGINHERDAFVQIWTYQ